MNTKELPERAEGIRFLREAQGYLERAVGHVEAGNRLASRQCMQRARECLTEASLRIRKPSKA